LVQIAVNLIFNAPIAAYAACINSVKITYAIVLDDNFLLGMIIAMARIIEFVNA
jgi:hypothetical protein